MLELFGSGAAFWRVCWDAVGVVAEGLSRGGRGLLGAGLRDWRRRTFCRHRGFVVVLLWSRLRGTSLEGLWLGGVLGDFV